MKVNAQSFGGGAEELQKSDIVRDITEYLDAQSREALRGIILREAERDEGFEKRLHLLSQADTEEVDIPRLRKALRQAIGSGRKYIEYCVVPEWVEDIQTVTDAIARLPLEGYAFSVMDLAEYGLDLMNEVLDSVEDPGFKSADVIDALQSLHLEGCRAFRIDPEELAALLLEKELNDRFCLYDDVLRRYADLLGEAGLARYRELAIERWEALPPAGVRQKDDLEISADDTQRSSLRDIVERLHKGDEKALIRILEKDLNGPRDYVELARRYDADHQPEKALEIAEKGRAIFCKKFEDRLLSEYLAEAYCRVGRMQDVWALLWKEYDRFPNFRDYERLKDYGRQGGVWENWKDNVIKRANKSATRRNASLSVQIYLAENMPEDAWKTAQKYGCNNPSWLALADIRATTHPQDAIDVYKRIAEGKMQLTGDEAYAQAFELIKKAEKLSADTEPRRAAFVEWIASIRKAYKRKRNMMKLLDKLSVPV